MIPAILLGSFDPPHVGHLSLISETLLSVDVSEVIIIPAYHNPDKPSQSKYTYRLDMTRMIPSLYPPGKVRISDLERTLAVEKSLEYLPTVTLLRELTKRISRFNLITTIETYKEISGWQGGQEILMIPDKFILPPKTIDISSTTLREMIASGRSVPEYIPQEIYQYIRQTKLYEKKK